ncbi:hypothetical protein R6Q59_020186 [Mikania micrantha]
MFNGRTNTTTVLWLSITMLMMVMMIKHCDGWMAACNDGSTAAECQMLVEEDQEFMMDTEEHRRILAGNSGHLVYGGALQKGNPACGNNCGGRYDPAGRKCKLYNYSCK